MKNLASQNDDIIILSCFVKNDSSYITNISDCFNFRFKVGKFKTIYMVCYIMATKNKHRKIMKLKLYNIMFMSVNYWIIHTNIIELTLC